MKLRILSLFLLISLSGYCNVKLPKVLGDNMVLQRKPINIWGWADAVPFRTDTWKGITEENKFTFD